MGAAATGAAAQVSSTTAVEGSPTTARSSSVPASITTPRRWAAGPAGTSFGAATKSSRKPASAAAVRAPRRWYLVFFRAQSTKHTIGSVLSSPPQKCSSLRAMACVDMAGSPRLVEGAHAVNVNKKEGWVGWRHAVKDRQVLLKVAASLQCGEDWVRMSRQKSCTNMLATDCTEFKHRFAHDWWRYIDGAAARRSGPVSAIKKAAQMAIQLTDASQIYYSLYYYSIS